MAATGSPYFGVQFFDTSGGVTLVAAGYSLFTYISGTTTNQATYTDAAGLVANANPIVLDSAGRCTLFLGAGLTYTFVLKTPGGAVVKTWDGVTAIPTAAATSFVPVAGGTMTGPLILSGNASAALQAVTLQQLTSAIAAGNAAALAAIPAGAPIGSICLWLSGVPPTNYLELNGAAVSRIDYAALFVVFGTGFGSGDGSSTFNLPDLRGEFLRFWDHSRGIDTGRTLGSAQAADIGAHTHPLTTLGRGNADGNDNLIDQGLVASTIGGAGFISNLTAASTGVETRPRNFSLMAIVRAL